MKKPIELRIYIEKPVFGGSGLGRSSGKAVFVPYSLPGETVLATVTDEHTDYIHAEIGEIVSPSSRRMRPECVNFEICGGCSYLHTDYDHELEIKKRIIADTLQRIAGFTVGDPAAIPAVTGNRFRYRSHCDIKYSGGKPGLYKSRTNDVIPFPPEGCLLLPHELNRAAFSAKRGEGSCRIAMDHEGGIHIHGDGSTVHESENGVRFIRGIDDFFQANRFIRAEMQKRVLKMSGARSDQSFLDVGCGIGFFSLLLAGHSLKGTGIERRKSSVSWAVRNAELNNIDNVSFLAIDAENIQPVKHRADLVILDPPRSGLSRKARDAIISLSPEKIVYVSCDPATFARDIKTFFAAEYSLGEIILIDMFPGTHHIEILGSLKRQ